MVMSSLPYLTTDLPGCGGKLRVADEDFAVDELAAYPPAGTGDHVLALVEKRGLTTMAAVDALARALAIDPRDIGSAGLKDRHAVTRQWLSLPPPVSPEAVLALELPGITVHSAARHPHKLRTGHLRGNRFTIRIRAVEPDADTAAARARAILDRLERPPGLANFFGEQRFGHDGDNAAQGRALVTGDPAPAGRRPPRQRQRRLLISAYQSELFNRYLRQRIADGLLATVVDGDLLQKPDSGGIFPSTDPAADQPRLDHGEVVPTGPMFGHRMMTPPANSAAAIREAAVLEAEGLSAAAFERVGKLGQGTRRPLAVPIGEPRVVVVDQTSIELAFALPPGSYATVLLREVVKQEIP